MTANAGKARICEKVAVVIVKYCSVILTDRWRKISKAALWIAGRSDEFCVRSRPGMMLDRSGRLSLVRLLVCYFAFNLSL
jgi:hypothetical protein